MQSFIFQGTCKRSGYFNSIKTGLWEICVLLYLFCAARVLVKKYSLRAEGEQPNLAQVNRFYAPDLHHLTVGNMGAEALHKFQQKK
ncbi:MAG TPA: hypothetical protein VGK21_02670 [Candidatus Angelobacter sp.]